MEEEHKHNERDHNSVLFVVCEGAQYNEEYCIHNEADIAEEIRHRCHLRGLVVAHAVPPRPRYFRQLIINKL